MPIKIADSLPAKGILESENIFVMTQTRALHQDIRPLRLVLLNLMPTKVETETQLFRCLSNTPLQIEIDLLHASTHLSKNTGAEHLESFYVDFPQIKHRFYDGMIITGAPIEQLPFEEVDYWSELCGIMEWTKTHVTSTFHICWGAQAALYYHYGVGKQTLPAKLFGVFSHRRLDALCPLTRGFDDVFLAPHSRYTGVSQNEVEAIPALRTLASSEEAGLYIAMARDGRQIFVTGHSEYDADTLNGEYQRDRKKGMDTALPKNYYPNDDPAQKPHKTWRSHSQLLYSNWLNYYVYQQTPFNLTDNNEQ